MENDYPWLTYHIQGTMLSTWIRTT